MRRRRAGHGDDPGAVVLRLRAGLAAIALAVAGCTTGAPELTVPADPTESVAITASPTVSPSPTRTPTPSPAAEACPRAYVAPDVNRPQVSLQFTLSADRRTVTGSERVTFTPDLNTDRLVFRLWPNTPKARRAGTRLDLLSAEVDGTTRRTLLSSDRSQLHLLGRFPRGKATTAVMTFRLVLPTGFSERWGTRSGVAWWGSGFPLLAWERGRGWALDPPTSAFAEATTSEVFQLKLSVKGPAGDTVLATGSRVGAGVFTAGAVRDVGVAVGRFRVAQGPANEAVVRVGVAPGMSDDPGRLLRLHQQAIAAVRTRFGPFPYESLDVAVVPDIRGGIEHPGLIMLGPRQDQGATLVHEVAHEWFYGLVGNNQARDPWLDEAFATYVEALIRGTGESYAHRPPAESGKNKVGAPMTYWEPRTSVYFRAVYLQGATALLKARRAAGAAAFDAALRCYVNAHAHAVATPAALAKALAKLPAALRVLRSYGALPAN